MQISLEKIAAAKACGITFLPASSEQVQRMSMQLKVFMIDGKPYVATRDMGFFETSATLDKLISAQLEQQQQADLEAWEASGSTGTVVDDENGSVVPDETGVEARSSVQVSDGLPLQEPETSELMNRTAHAVADAPRSRKTLPVPAPALVPSVPLSGSDLSTTQHRGRWWMLAGAERRGRVAQHWSLRRKTSALRRSQAR